MKRYLLVLLSVIAILFGIYIIFSQTNMLKSYKISSASNEPGIKRGANILVSNLVDYKKGDFICFKHNDNKLGEHVRVYRLVGEGGDELEIKDGILYLNHQNFDKNLVLKHFYIIEPKAYKQLLENNLLGKEQAGYQMGDKVIILLTNKFAEKIGIASKMKIEPKDKVDKSIFKRYQMNWNMDNFGPLKIPEGKYFVMGDNRHAALDSRFIGLIDKADIIGKVIGK